MASYVYLDDRFIELPYSFFDIVDLFSRDWFGPFRLVETQHIYLFARKNVFRCVKLNIKVKCRSPKYVAGEYIFSSLEELYHWLSLIKGLPRHGAGRIIYMVAKEGSWHQIYGRLDAEIKSDYHDYFLTGKIVKEIGFTGRKAFADKEKVLAFCKAFDKYVEMKNGE